MSKLTKRFAHKIYDNTGVYIMTLPADLITNLPSYTWSINGGMGEMVIHLAMTIKEFSGSYENSIIKFGNIVRTVVTDIPNGQMPMRIFSGYITAYEPIMNDEGHEEIIIHVTSTTKTLADQIFHDGAATTKAYNSLDPANILKNVLDKYGGIIHYTGSTIAPTSTTVSYTMSFLSYREAVDICLGLCPSFWYWYVDADDVFWLQQPNFDVINHLLFIGKQVTAINANKSIEQLYNEVFFKGGGEPPLYKTLSRSASITDYGRRAYKMQDERVTVAGTATTFMNKFLDEHDHPLSEVLAKVIDNAASTDRGYDIESFRPGQVVQIKHPRIGEGISLWDVAEWDIDFWDFNIIYSLSLPMQIIEINYQFDHVILKLSLVPPDVAHRIEDINRNLDTVRSEGIPSTPS